MKQITAQFLRDASQQYGDGTAEIRESYSGRGMFGRETVGVVCDNITDLLTAAIFLAYAYAKYNDESFQEVLDEVAKSFKQDNMGTRYILY